MALAVISEDIVSRRDRDAVHQLQEMRVGELDNFILNSYLGNTRYSTNWFEYQVKRQ